MKKLLLLSLLVVGANSFAVQTVKDAAKLPIVVTGTVADMTSSALNIQVINANIGNANTQGQMIFDFSNKGILKGTTTGATASYLISRPDSSNITTEDKTTVVVGLVRAGDVVNKGDSLPTDITTDLMASRTTSGTTSKEKIGTVNYLLTPLTIVNDPTAGTTDKVKTATGDVKVAITISDKGQSGDVFRDDTVNLFAYVGTKK